MRFDVTHSFDGAPGSWLYFGTIEARGHFAAVEKTYQKLIHARILSRYYKVTPR